MTSDQNKSIAILIHLIVMNNAFGVAKALKAEGYDIKNYIPAPQLEVALLQLSIMDKDKFFRVMKSIPWNPGHSETNQQNIINNMIALTQTKVNGPIDKKNWWPSLINYISTQ